VWVTGSDAVSFVDGLVSQNVAGMNRGETRPGLLLAPNGKLRSTLHLLRYEDRVGLACDAGRTEIVHDDLSRFKIRVDVVIEVEPRPIWDIWGRDAPSVMEGHTAGADPIGDGPVVFDRPFARSDLPRVVIIGDPPAIERLSALDIEPTRIEVGEPIMGIDLTEKTIPQEGVDVAAAVDFGKGCYLGQELVARIDSRGHVNQRLVGIVFAGTEVPPVEAEVLFEGKAVGSLTSAARSELLGAPIGLGMIRTEAPFGAQIEAGTVVGTIGELPLAP
jgi:folate-binding protein YgfZ